ncbi:hypothetical protein TUM4438_35960 [Shewanella sairae]|uniref:DUF3575 domain-containing protein n=1 Tax=Shewanella sairae TaxID=190310 RepID=A0ABQ4PP28_9GAMM|nr:hypothetical protein [Shewanella sairae]MCL1130946.1 hypothetical protein [Shewanella sairae]GIU50343.1 hypothetical protein TUM4438_35960 [Shewanella sairae]
MKFNKNLLFVGLVVSTCAYSEPRVDGNDVAITSSHSNSIETTADTSFSLGIGYQYGGVLGVRYNYQKLNHVFFGSLGLVGGALGYQYAFSEQKHLFGFSVGSEVLTSEDGFAVLTYEYYPKGFTDGGWQFGVSGGVRREDDGGSFGNVGKTATEPTGMISLGYKF